MIELRIENPIIYQRITFIMCLFMYMSACTMIVDLIYIYFILHMMCHTRDMVLFHLILFQRCFLSLNSSGDTDTGSDVGPVKLWLNFVIINKPNGTQFVLVLHMDTHTDIYIHTHILVHIHNRDTCIHTYAYTHIYICMY